MFTLLAACALSLPSVPTPSVAPSLALFEPAREDEEIPDKRIEVKERLDAFKGHIKERGEEDMEAVALVDILLQDWEFTGPKDRADVVKTFATAYKQKRKQDDDGTYEDMLYTAVTVALGEMGGPDAAKVLASWIGHKQHRANTALQRTLILSLGRTREPSGMKTLLGLLKHSEPVIQGAGAEALGYFETADGRTRKKIFEAVLKQIAPLHSDVQNDTGADQILRERYDTVAGPMIATLRQLSGHEERDPLEFQRWWNKNKKSDWDDAS